MIRVEFAAGPWDFGLGCSAAFLSLRALAFCGWLLFVGFFFSLAKMTGDISALFLLGGTDALYSFVHPRLKLKSWVNKHKGSAVHLCRDCHWVNLEKFGGQNVYIFKILVVIPGSLCKEVFTPHPQFYENSIPFPSMPLTTELPIIRSYNNIIIIL